MAEGGRSSADTAARAGWLDGGVVRGLEFVGVRVGVLLGATAFIFFGTAVLPGDFVTQMLAQEDFDPVLRDRLRAELGIDRPLPERFLRWLFDFVTGDFGTSFATRTPVWQLVEPRLSNSLKLAGLTLAIFFPLSLVIGALVFLAGHRVRAIFRAITQVVVCTPEFFIAYVLIYLLAVEARLLPAVSRISDAMPPAEQLRFLLLPSLCLGVVMVAHVARLVTSLFEIEEAKDYYTFMLLKGLRPSTIVLRLSATTVAPALVNLFFIYCAWLVTGVIVIEVIFGFAGLGELAVASVVRRDVPTIQFCAVVVTTVYVVCYSIADAVADRSGRRLRL